jgi:hypothetical protein
VRVENLSYSKAPFLPHLGEGIVIDTPLLSINRLGYIGGQPTLPYSQSVEKGIAVDTENRYIFVRTYASRFVGAA